MSMITVYRCSRCGFERQEGLCACSPQEPPLVAIDYVPAARLREAHKEIEALKARLEAVQGDGEG